MDGELLIKIVQRIKTVAGIEVFLVLPVAALYLAVVAGRVGTDELVVYTELCSGIPHTPRPAPSATTRVFRTSTALLKNSIEKSPLF